MDPVVEVRYAVFSELLFFKIEIRLSAYGLAKF